MCPRGRALPTHQTTIISSLLDFPFIFDIYKYWYKSGERSSAEVPVTFLSAEKIAEPRKVEGEASLTVAEKEEEEAKEGNLRSGRHLRVIGKRIPRDSPPSSFGVAHPRRELPRDSSHPDGSVWGARPSYHRHALGECHPSIPSVLCLLAVYAPRNRREGLPVLCHAGLDDLWMMILTSTLWSPPSLQLLQLDTCTWSRAFFKMLQEGRGSQFGSVVTFERPTFLNYYIFGSCNRHFSIILIRFIRFLLSRFLSTGWNSGITVVFSASWNGCF